MEHTVPLLPGGGEGGEVGACSAPRRPRGGEEAGASQGKREGQKKASKRDKKEENTVQFVDYLQERRTISFGKF